MKTTKFLALLLCVILLSSCAQNIDQRGQRSNDDSDVLIKHKYKIGDIVYLKPDSVKAVIEELTDSNSQLLIKKNTYEVRPTYSLYYFRPDGMKNIERSVDEALIF